MDGDQSAILDEVEAAYRHYVEVFNRRDPNEIAELYHRPHAQLIGDVGLSIVADDADQQEWYELVMAHLDDQGWGRTEIDKVWIWPISHSVAQLIANITRYSVDGSVLNQVRANYTFCRRDGSWRVVLSLPLLEEGFTVPVLPAASD
jgi:hypothetical protein